MLEGRWGIFSGPHARRRLRILGQRLWGEWEEEEGRERTG